VDGVQSPDQSENNINDINVLEFYHVIRWNLEYSAHRPVHGDPSGEVCTAVAVSYAPMVWEAFLCTGHMLTVVCNACHLWFLQAGDGHEVPCETWYSTAR